MVEQAPPWPKQGPASYFPSIEKKYGRSIAEWQQIIAGCGLEKHTAIVGYLKSEHGMGHGHASALVGWTLAGNVASSEALKVQVLLQDWRGDSYYERPTAHTTV
jgi:hypothetical protein